MIRKKVIVTTLCMFIVLFAIIVVYAGSIPERYVEYIVDGRVDFKELHKKYFQTRYGPLIAPTSSFAISVNDTIQVTSDSGDILLVKMGDALSIQNTSILGSGDKWNKCDFQISDGISIIYSTTSIDSITIPKTLTDKEGTYNIYLNVMDNEDMIKTEGWGNWAYNGSQRSAGTNPGGGTGKDFPGWWYYSKLTIVVEKNKPTADFKIYYKGEDVTDNSTSPITVDPGDKSLVLEDCSTPYSPAEPIVTRKWSYWDVAGGWKEIPGSANRTTVNIADMDAGLPGEAQNKAFKLEVTSSAEGSDHAEHTAYFKKVLTSGYIIYYRDEATERDIYPSKERPGLGFGTYTEHALPAPANSMLVTPSPATIVLNAAIPFTTFTFYYRMDKPQTDKPPSAILDAPDTVRAGEVVRANGSRSWSNNPGGYIADYDFRYEGANLSSDNGSSVRIWYPHTGTYRIELKVEDEAGSTDSAEHEITVTQPIPAAILDITGNLKENRKVTIDSSRSTSTAYYPIDISRTDWSIAPVTGGTDSDIKYLGALDGNESKDILFKKAGRYRIRLTVRNTYGLSASAETTITIARDIPPVAKLFMPTPSGVEYGIYRTPSDSNYAAAEIFNESTSIDGDIIDKAVVMYCYDSDNDGNYREETWFYSKDGTDWAPVGMTYSDMVGYFNIYGIATGSPQKFTLKSKEVGRYYFAIRVMETIPEDETIPEFINESDYRRGDSFNQ
ncbi:MAG TPA: PKD domain-containing protein [Candidatus Nitrosocosmicus sp.]|nr:PKD domain-containing protein [Candidatus Nitrosocosmicus sp.]